MIEVFVESNWVFDYCAPQHRRRSEAADLVAQAAAKRVRVHIPAICLREGAESVRRKCKPKVGDVATYRRLAAKEGRLSEEQSKVVVAFFEQYTRDVQADLDRINDRLDDLQAKEGLEVFALDEDMLDRVLAIRHIHDVWQLKPFDEAILGAVLVGSERLRDAGAHDVRFFTKDSDLWPWSPGAKDARKELKGLYDAANVWVQSRYDTTVVNPLA